MRIVKLAIIAIAAAAACGRSDGAPASATSVAAADPGAASPIEKPYHQKDASELDIERLFALFPLYMRPTYEKASFDARTGATLVTGLKFGDVGAGKGFTAARAEFYGVDLAMIETLEKADGAALDAPMHPVLAKLRLFEIERIMNAAPDGAVEGDEGGATNAAPTVLTIGAAEIDSLNIREGGIPKETPATGLAAFFNAFEVAGIYFTDISVKGGDEEVSDSGAAFDFSAEDLRIIGLGGGRLSAMIGNRATLTVRQSAAATQAAINGLNPAMAAIINGPLKNFIAPEHQKTTVKTIEWRDIDLSGLMSYGLKGEKPPITARALINLGTAHIIDTQNFIGEKRVSVVPETDISAMEFVWLAPSKIRAVSRGGLYDFTAYLAEDQAEAIKLLKARNLNRVKADSDFAYDWNADRGSAAFSTGFQSQGLADFDFDLAVEGMELAKIEEARLAGSATPLADLGMLKSLSMTLVDEQLLDAFYELSALETGGTAKDMRAATPTMMRIANVDLKRKNPKIAEYVEAIIEFLEDGGTLEIRAAPEAPVPLTAIVAAAAAGGPDATAASIGLTVTHKK